MGKKVDNVQHGMMFSCFPGSLLPIGKPQILALQNLQMYTPARGNIDPPKENEETWTRDVGLPERKMPAPSSVRAFPPKERQTSL